MGQSTCEHDVRPSAEPGKQSELSAPDPYEGAPPRLSPCLNGPTDEQPERRLPEGEAAKPEHIESILQWVTDRLLDSSLDDVWKNPGGRHPNEGSNLSDAEKKEEEWAKLVENMFFGTAYGGPDVMHSTPGKTGVYFNITGLYGRLSGLDDLYDSPEDAKQKDPAYSLWVACQHLSSYGALTRGVQLMQEMNGAGFPASQAAAALKLFQPKGRGKWYVPHDSSIEIDGKEADFAKAPASPHKVDEVPGLREGKGAGAIYTYNPAKDMKLAMLRLDEAYTREVDENGLPKIDAQRICQDYQQAARTANKENMAEYQRKTAAALQASKTAAQLSPALAGMFPYVPSPLPAKVGPVDLMAQDADPSGGTLVPLNFQFDGSHISMVLRSYVTRGKPVVQLLDTSSHHSPAGVPADTASPYLVLGKMDGSIVAGNAFTEVPAYSGGKFVGLGLLPELTNTDVVFDNMRRARPVGLGRLVITKKSATANMTEDDVLFMSRMIPLWGKGEQQNFNLPMLLWSLRNTPYHETLKAHWFVYSPRGELAKVMWKSGARDQSFWEMADEAVKEIKSKAQPGKTPRETLVTGQDTLPVAVLSHESNGTCVQLWRNHGLKPGGVGAVDKLLRQYFIDAGPPAERVQALYNAAGNARSVWVNERTSRVTANSDRLAALPGNSPERDVLTRQNDQLLEELRNGEPDFFAQLGAVQDASGMQAHLLKIARDNPKATYVPKAWREQGLDLPSLLELSVPAEQADIA